MKLTLKTLALSLGVVIAAVIVLTAWVYSGISRDPVTTGLQKISPAALVGYGMISIADWNSALDAAKNFGGDASTAQRQLIRNKQMEMLVGRLRLRVSGEDVLHEFKYIISTQNAEYEKLKDKNFGGSDELFINLVAKPQAVEAQLRIKFNNDLNTNNDAHTRAQNILSLLKQGGSFEELAKKVSDDKVTGQIGGDLGFAPIEEFVPELQNPIREAKKGEVVPVVVISRFGYHILYVADTATGENGQELWHVKHILVATQNYDQWLDSQLRRVEVFRIK